MPISVVIPTLVRDSLYPLLDALAQQDCEELLELVLVCQPPGRLQRQRLPEQLPATVIEADLGLGFGHYRRLGAEAARGDILAWIDDDEIPMDRSWLSHLSAPIRQGTATVVTAGTHIRLGQGYLTDCMSWLGFPGGAYPGFEVMWPVDADGHADHLCSGNFAILRSTLQQVGNFSDEQHSGNEDTELADRLMNAGHRIRYCADATVEHLPRTQLGEFVRWHIKRGAAHRELLRGAGANRRAGSKVSGRLGSSLRIVALAARSRYLPGVIVMTLVQYVAQLAGYLGGRSR